MPRTLFVVLAALMWFSAPALAQKTKLEGVVNLNTASPEELGLIPGVGPARVRNILAYRRAHPFRSVDELARIKGIGRKTVRRWRLHLAVVGPSTAQRVLRPEKPEVMPLPVPAPPPTVPKATPAPHHSAAGPPRSTHPRLPRGEPAQIESRRSAGNSCLPPP